MPRTLRWILIISAFVNITTFPGLIAVGVLKGVERFGTLRSVELSQSLVYVVGVVVAAFANAPYTVVVYIAIGTIVFTNAIKALIAWRIGSRLGLKLTTVVPPDARHEVGTRAWLITQSKIIGAAQGPLLPVLLSWLFGPRAVGVYDILQRLPRAAKTILSLLNVALLPVSTRIEEADATEQRRRLGRIGMILLPAITVPPLVICAALSRPILHVWIGTQVVDFWPWMAAVFMIPICAQYVGFGGVMAISHSATLEKDESYLDLAACRHRSHGVDIHARAAGAILHAWAGISVGNFTAASACGAGTSVRPPAQVRQPSDLDATSTVASRFASWNRICR